MQSTSLYNLPISPDSAYTDEAAIAELKKITRQLTEWRDEYQNTRLDNPYRKQIEQGYLLACQRIAEYTMHCVEMEYL